MSNGDIVADKIEYYKQGKQVTLIFNDNSLNYPTGWNTWVTLVSSMRPVSDVFGAVSFGANGNGFIKINSDTGEVDIYNPESNNINYIYGSITYFTN